MKKTLFSILATFSVTVSAANYFSVDVDYVRTAGNGTDSVAQYIRAGTDQAGIQLGLQGRTASLKDSGGLLSSVEVTAGTSLGFVSPFVGVARDNGFNGANAYTYGLVGATTGMPVGPGFALAGVKARVASTEDHLTKQVVTFGTYSIPVTKTMSLNLNLSKSFQDIKEDAAGVGVGFKF